MITEAVYTDLREDRDRLQRENAWLKCRLSDLEVEHRNLKRQVSRVMRDAANAEQRSAQRSATINGRW